MSYMKEYMLDQVYKLGEKAGLTPNEAEDIYLNACDGKCGAYCRLIDTYHELRAYLIQAYMESMACEKDI